MHSTRWGDPYEPVGGSIRAGGGIHTSQWGDPYAPRGRSQLPRGAIDMRRWDDPYAPVGRSIRPGGALDILPGRLAGRVDGGPTAVGHPGDERTPRMGGTRFAVHRRVTTLEIRGTAGDLLHRTVARGTAELRAACAAAERTLPWFVWRELERYGACGDPEEGFAWLHCPQDDHHRLVPFSCKGRAFCPACIGRRMAEMSRRWCDTLLPHVPYRQWVITVPWARRKRLAYQPELARGVLALALDEIFAWLTEEAREQLGLVDVRCGAVTVQQRWGSALTLNLHYHSLVPDGSLPAGRRGAAGVCAKNAANAWLSPAYSLPPIRTPYVSVSRAGRSTRAPSSAEARLAERDHPPATASGGLVRRRRSQTPHLPVLAPSGWHEAQDNAPTGAAWNRWTPRDRVLRSPLLDEQRLVAERQPERRLPGRRPRRPAAVTRPPIPRVIADHG